MVFNPRAVITHRPRPMHCDSCGRNFFCFNDMESEHECRSCAKEKKLAAR